MKVGPVPTPSAPPAAGPYSPAVRAGDWLVLAGQVGLDPATGKMVDGGVDAQARQVLANIGAVLRDCGAQMTDVAKTTVFVADIAEFPTVNAAYELKRDTGGPFGVKSSGLLVWGKAEGVLTNDRLALAGRLERKLNTRTALFGQVQYLRDSFKAIDYLNHEPADAARRMGIRQQTTGEQFQAALKNLRIPSREENLGMIGGANPGLVSSGRRLMTLMLDAKLLRARLEIEEVLAPAPLSSLPP